MVNVYFSNLRKLICLDLSGFERKNDWPSIVAVAGDWLIVGSCISLSVYTGSWLIYLLSIPVISGRMMALGFLMHEAGHNNLFKNRWFNRWVSELFLAWPLFLSMRKYRSVHAKHHKYLKTERDTEAPLSQYKEYQFPQKKALWYGMLLLDLSGIHFFYYAFKKLSSRQSKAINPISAPVLNAFYKALRTGYYLLLFSNLVYFDLWWEYVLFWIIPYVTWFQLVVRLQVCSEHFGLPHSVGYQTRSLVLNRVEKFFFFPHNKHYHTEHHIYPEVYFARLESLHRMLIKEPVYAANTQVTYGISGLFKELTYD
ncbi:MAG: fatty acid desaturase family protein [Roseivirga sp.]|nr:fatty acid desaturase family protein [Roseivirga sp.]